MFQENSFIWKHPLSKRSLRNPKQETTRGQGQIPTQTNSQGAKSQFALPEMFDIVSIARKASCPVPAWASVDLKVAGFTVLSEVLRHRQGQRQDSVQLDTQSLTTRQCHTARCSFIASNNTRVLHMRNGTVVSSSTETGASEKYLPLPRRRSRENGRTS